MARNVFASWAGHLVVVVGGFILPRLIDSHVGRSGLGVWDFAWSLVAYFGLVQGGVVSSVNRYVAKYRAKGDIDGISCTVSSVTMVLLLMAGAILVLTLGVTFIVPSMLEHQLHGYAGEARWVILLLGASLATQTSLSGYGGVITGHHRWDVQYGIQATAYLIMLIGMVAVLLLGGGLIGLAAVTLATEILGRQARCWYAYRICPGLRVRPRYASRAMAAQMLTFGVKSMIPHIGGLFVTAGVSSIIVAALGANALALYARPRALVRHMSNIVEKFAFVLTPTASSLQATGHDTDLREFFVQATRIGVYIALPITLVLAILGDHILRLWMGPDYVQWALLAILAVGHLAWVVQMPSYNILSGLNMHGRPGFANMVASIIAAIGVFVVMVVLKRGLVAAALALTLPSTLANVCYVPLYACARLKMSVWDYAWAVLRGPVACAAPFAACLVLGRLCMPDRPLAVLGAALPSGGLVLVLLYWRFVLPASVKRKLTRPIFGRGARPAPESY